MEELEGADLGDAFGGVLDPLLRGVEVLAEDRPVAGHEPGALGPERAQVGAAAGTAVKPEDIVAGLGGVGAGGGADLSSFGAKGAGFVASDWTILGKDLFATKEWIKDSAEGVTEVGTLKLFHTPG